MKAELFQFKLKHQVCPILKKLYTKTKCMETIEREFEFAERTSKKQP
ncbi:hypothetical protein SAMN05421877_11398, partial [Sphingobacterium lactis]